MGTLVARIRVEHAPQPERLVGDEAHRPAAQPREGGHEIAGEGRLEFEHRLLVGDQRQHLAHVVGLARRDRHQVEQRIVDARDRARVCGDLLRGACIARQVGQEPAGDGKGLVLAGDAQIGNTLAVDLHVGAPQFHRVDILAGRRLDQGRARDAHGRLATHHDDEIGKAGVVGGACEAGAQHQRHHRNPARGAGEVVERGIGLGEVARILSVLDAVAAAVEHEDQRHAAGDRDLQRAMDLGAAQHAGTAAEHREVL